MANPDFTGHQVKLSDPARNVLTITPSDGALLAYPVRALHCTVTAGLVKVDTAGGDVAVFLYLALGAVVPVQCTKVYSTGTAATGIVGFA